MKLFKLMKEGGPFSRVYGYFLIEWKLFLSIVLLNFKDGTREAFHSHAFGAISWVLRGQLTEELMDGTINVYRPSLKPIVTPRSCFHKVKSKRNTWALSFRGPWADTWQEFIPATKQTITLTHGRKVLN